MFSKRFLTGNSCIIWKAFHPISTLKHFVKDRSSTINGAMFVKSDAICDVREMVPLCTQYLTAVKKVNKP